MEWHVLRVWMKGTASRHGRWLWTHWICSRGQPTMHGPPAWGLNIVLITAHHKTSTCYKPWWEVVHWTHLAQDTDTWHAIVNNRIILGVQLNAGTFLIRWETTRFTRTRFRAATYFVRWNQKFSDHNYSNNAGSCHGWEDYTCISRPIPQTFHSLQ